MLLLQGVPAFCCTTILSCNQNTVTPTCSQTNGTLCSSSQVVKILFKRNACHRDCTFSKSER